MKRQWLSMTLMIFFSLLTASASRGSEKLASPAGGKVPPPLIASAAGTGPMPARYAQA
jgi:hypothetical protein